MLVCNGGESGKKKAFVFVCVCVLLLKMRAILLAVTTCLSIVFQYPQQIDPPECLRCSTSSFPLRRADNVLILLLFISLNSRLRDSPWTKTNKKEKMVDMRVSRLASWHLLLRLSAVIWTEYWQGGPRMNSHNQQLVWKPLPLHKIHVNLADNCPWRHPWKYVLLLLDEWNNVFLIFF